MGIQPLRSRVTIKQIWEGIKAGGDAEKLQSAILQSSKSLRRFSSTWRYLNPDGRIVYHEGFGNPSKKHDGSVVWDSLIVDVTERFELAEMAQNIAKIARIGSWEAILKDGVIADYRFSKNLIEILQADNQSPIDFFNLFQFTDHKVKRHFSRFIKKALLKSGSFEEDFSVFVGEKELKWIHFVVKSECHHSQLIRFYGYVQDVTAKKLSELQIQNALSEKNKILESIGDGFFAVNWIGQVTYWNKSAEELIQIPREDCLGKSIWPLFPVDTRKKFTRFLRQIQEKKSSHIHKQDFFQDFDKWFEVNIYISEVGFSVFFTDITKRKLAEEEIKQSNERFVKISNATNDIIWDYDLENDRFFIGEGFQRLTGYKIGNKITSLEEVRKFIFEEDVDKIFDGLCQAFQSPNESNFQQEFRIKIKNDEYAYVINRGTIIRNRSGVVIRALGSMTDITYQKNYEKSLQTLNENLKKKAFELEKSNKELEQFAYVASHDLQEPLRMVNSFMGLLKKRYKDSLDERALTYIDFAVQGSEQMKAIIFNLLEFSKVQQEDVTLSLFDFQEILEPLKINLNKEIKLKGATISLSNSTVLFSNKSMLFQVFQNLISNALKYSDSEREPQIDISVKDEGEHYLFQVKDNGLGIREEYLDKIFALFSRLHTRDKIPGTGLGLAIVKKIVEKLGGEIWVNSTVGVGSIFSFKIPKNDYENHIG
ncbi:PAS domain-containing sensor histidine kinase [Algoriphagus algorifonticola]|uniref:PAS domain-containing sensor histidine kinase n=1 Tax=Algoriphagus algorifonticola TaxID=2593007 RepID=UPI0011A4BBC4|nr:ATP-binding protein [Algoriphagus algorifonticola]